MKDDIKSGKARNRFHFERVAAKRKAYRMPGHVTRDTPARCSCWMCGNPRRHFGRRTIQERRMGGGTEDIGEDIGEGFIE